MQQVMFFTKATGETAVKAFYAARKTLRAELGKSNTGTLADKEVITLKTVKEGVEPELAAKLAIAGRPSWATDDRCAYTVIGDGEFLFYGWAELADKHEQAAQAAAEIEVQIPASDAELETVMAVAETKAKRTKKAASAGTAKKPAAKKPAAKKKAAPKSDVAEELAGIEAVAHKI